MSECHWINASPMTGVYKAADANDPEEMFYWFSMAAINGDIDAGNTSATEQPQYALDNPY